MGNINPAIYIGDVFISEKALLYVVILLLSLIFIILQSIVNLRRAKI